MQTSPERASHRARAARFSRRPPSFVVTLVALAIVFALAWMFFIRAGEGAPAPRVDGIRGTYTWTVLAEGATGVPLEEGSFAAVASGDAGGSSVWRNTAPRAGTGGSARSAYDAATRTETTLATRTSRLGGRTEQTLTTGSWPPAWSVATRSPLDYQGLAAVVRSAEEDGDDSIGIKPLKQGDRTVWRAAFTVDGRLVNVVVDQETGIVTWFSSDEETFTAEVDWGSPPPAAATWSASSPHGTEDKTVTSAPAYAPTPAAAARDAGYAPLVSDLAPDGYTLKAVATVPAELRPVSWVDDEPRSLPVGLPGRAVLELYTRGLSSFTVEQAGPETMRSLEGLRDWDAAAREDRLSLQETTLQFGAFKGETALTWYQASGPSLFVAGERRAVFVTGALTRQELIAVAEGLKPVPAAE